MSFASARRWALSETFRGLFQNKGLFALSTLLAALALSIPLFISAIFYEFAEPVRALPTAVEITVFPNKGADAKAIAKLVSTVGGIEKTEIIARDTAMQELNDQLGLKNKTLENNPLPDIIVATVRDRASTREVDAAADAIEKIKGVQMIAYETAWRDKLQALSRAALTTVGCLGAVVLALVMLVLAAAIRMTTASAMPQMKVLYLFGASPSFAMRPFAWRGFLMMAAASLGALGITQAGLTLLREPMAGLAKLYGISLQLSMPGASWCAGFVLACSVAGYIVAVVSAHSSWRKVQS